MFTNSGSGWSVLRKPSFRSVLRDYRLSRGMTQADVCLKIGWDLTRLSQIESRKVRPSRDTVDKIMAVLQLEDHERGYLLLLGGYIPEEQEIDNTWNLTRTRLESWPFPAYLTDFSFRLLRWNQITERVFWFVAPFLEEIRRNYTNSLELIVNPRYGLKEHLGTREWERLAREELLSFQLKQVAHMREPWCQKLLQRLSQFEDFTELWREASLNHVRRPFDLSGQISLTKSGRKLNFALMARPVDEDPRFETIFSVPDVPTYTALQKLDLLPGTSELIVAS